MGYPAITAFLKAERRSAEDAARNAAKEWANKSEEELAVLLVPECQAISDLMDQAAHAAELKRQVNHLTFQMSDEAQKARLEFAAAEQRSRDLADRPQPQGDTG